VKKTPYQSYVSLRAQVLSLLGAPRHLTQTAWVKGVFLQLGGERKEVCAVHVHFDPEGAGRFEARVTILSRCLLSSETAGYGIALSLAFELARNVEELTRDFALQPGERAAFVRDLEQAG